MISVQEYDALEAKAIARLPRHIVQAFQPVQFIRSGFPIRIKEMSELPNFADHLVEPETPLYFADGSQLAISGWSNGFTQEEFDLVQPIRKIVRDATAELGRPVRPMLMPMIHLAAARAIRALSDQFNPRKPPGVFEVGPGTGYLGPLMNAMGHDYACMDITQALALWQTFLHEACGMKPRNIWWWDYLNAAPAADVIYSNANLSEMTPLALSIILNRAASQLYDSNLAALCYFHTGDPHHVAPGDVENALRGAGFELFQTEPVTIWRLNGRPPIVKINLDPIGDKVIWSAREMAWCIPGDEPAGFDPAFVFGAKQCG